MARRKTKPDKPSFTGDVGPETEAAMAGATIEPLEREGRSTVRRKYRDHLLETLAKPRTYRGAVCPPQITARQRNAGIILFEAWCATETTPEKGGVYVDASPDWAAVILGRIERTWAFANISRGIPGDCEDVVKRAVLMQIHPHEGTTSPSEARRAMDRLRRGLDALADFLYM